MAQLNVVFRGLICLKPERPLLGVLAFRYSRHWIIVALHNILKFKGFSALKYFYILRVFFSPPAQDSWILAIGAVLIAQ